MILGEYPFSEPDKEKLKLLIAKKEICVTKKEKTLGVSKEVLDLIDKMLIKEPDDRLALIDVLHHPWIIGEQEKLHHQDEDTDTDFNCRETISVADN